MSDVFLSYASADRARARVLADGLARRGHSVWWDRTIPPGRVFDDVIQEAIVASRCMIVLWSADSVRSNWVKTEAAEGAARNMLLPVLIGAVVPPIEFKRIQAADLSGWDGDESDPEYLRLVESVEGLIRQPSDAAGAPARAAGPATLRQHTSAASHSPRQDTAAVPQPPRQDKAAFSQSTRQDAAAAPQPPHQDTPAMPQHRRQDTAAVPRSPRQDTAAASQPRGARFALFALGAVSSLAVVGAVWYFQDLSGGNSAASAVTTSAPTPPDAATVSTATAASMAVPSRGRINLLAPENGGQLLLASTDKWELLIDGKEETYVWTDTGFGVFGFRDDRSALIDTVAILIPTEDNSNLKEFELLAGDAGPNGPFQSIGRFSTENIRVIRDPFQQFRFPPVTAKYVKLRSLSSHGGSSTAAIAYEVQLFGELQ